MRLRRAASGLAVTAALAGSMLVLAEPALACVCGQRGAEERLRDGEAIAIVVRTDDGLGDLARYRVEDEIGADLPAELTSPIDRSSSCGQPLPPDWVGALIVSREWRWQVGACSDVDLAAALVRAQGAPTPRSGGPTAAFAAGEFGGSRLAALDQRGTVVAWDGLAGTGSAIAVCPGGERVVVAGRDLAGETRAGRAELTVHDADDLRVLRTVRLPMGNRADVRALRCLDRAAKQVDVVVRGSSAPRNNKLLRIEASGIGSSELGGLRAVRAIGDDLFIVSAGGAITVVREDGGQEDLAQIEGHDVDSPTFSPDGRTLVDLARRDGSPVVVSFDVASGDRLGEWTPPVPFLAGLTWIGPDRIAVRQGFAGERGPVQLQVFDRTLRPGATWPLTSGARSFGLGAVGGAVVLLLGPRLTVQSGAGAPLVADELRLARAQHIVGVPGRAFTVDAATPAAGTEEPGALFDIEEGPTYRGPVLVGLTALIGTALLIRRYRARR